jgi:hypothetical protein
MVLRRPILSGRPAVTASSTDPTRRVVAALVGDLSRRPLPPQLPGNIAASRACEDLTQLGNSAVSSFGRRLTDPAVRPDLGEVRSVFGASVTLAEVAAMSAERRRHFLLCLSAKLLRDVPPLRREATEGDIFWPIPLRDWQDLFAGHKLALQLVRSLPADELARWVDRRFIVRLVALFHSADRSEQSAAELLVATVFAVLEGTRAAIFDEILRVLVGFVDGLTPFLCVAPALRFFIKYFNSLAGKWTAAHANVFRDVFCPLFTCDSYEALCQLCTGFYQRDCNFANWALRFMAAHWPRTNSQKAVVYFHHASVAAQFSTVSGDQRLVSTLFGFVVREVQSANFRVALAAIALCVDMQFIGIFTACLPVLLPEIIDAVGVASRHWNEAVREKSNAALLALVPLGQRIRAVSRQESPLVSEEERKDTWVLITQMAADSGG